MHLHFNSAEVRRLIEHTEAGSKHPTLYDQANTAKPGLWLVGDSGVYIMSNAEPGLLSEGGKDKIFVAYAAEVNPHTLPFEAWWEAKHNSFGGDDGAEFLELDAIKEALAQGHDTIALDVTKNTIAVLIPKTKKP